MEVDKDLMFGLIGRDSMPQFTMVLGGRSCKVDKIQLSHSDVPVTRPTTRGGVYFTDKMAFKIRAQVSDDSISKMLSKTMLGPNSDFENIQFLANVDSSTLRLFANLTNYVQKREYLELSLMVVGTDLS
ncbi:hypothetical protein [Candidatus Nitrosotenuis cloacae]|uniref:hypothetical protein n=1 Tax=Candidatus Nitrosotenuis cloacae TaxID=1603555 RepID=UPI002281D4B0|nr:hypothetical protein [Candidatus Nitrosotenuis cloacae]